MAYQQQLAIFIPLAVSLAIVGREFWKRKTGSFVRGATLDDPYPGTARPTGANRYLFGQRYYSFRDLNLSTVIVGAPGAGKTVIMSLLMKTVLPRMTEEEPEKNPGQGSNVRAVVYDSKSDLLPIIRGMGVPEEKIIVLNPLDERVTAWDMAGDITTKAQASEVATSLVPLPEGVKDPFFIESAQRLLEGLIEVFQEHAPGRWELRDLILAAETPERMAFLYQSYRPTYKLIERFEPQRTFQSVKQTLNKELDNLEVVAASWHTAMRSQKPRVMSIKDWLSSQSVLVLGNDTEAKKPLRKINNLLLSQVIKSTLGRPGRREEENFFFLDEFRELGYIDEMQNLLGVGRSKGCATVIGFQDIYGVDSVYGKEKRNELLGCCANIGIMHINSADPDTQDWASQVVGEHEFKRTTFGNSVNEKGERTDNENEQVHTEKLWFPSLFSEQIPKVTLEDGCQALFKVGRWYQSNIKGKHLFTDAGTWNRVPSPDESFPNQLLFEREPKLTDWDANDFKRLSILGLDKVAAIKPKLSAQYQFEEVLKEQEQPEKEPELAEALDYLDFDELP